MIIFAKPILEMLFPNASSGEFLYQISAISIVFITLEQTINGALQGLGKVYIPVIALGAGVIVKLITNIILIKINPNDFILGGTVGAAVGTLLCHIISMIISICALKKNIKIRFELKKFVLKPITATSIMVILSFNTYKILNGIINQNIAIILTIIFAMIVYIVSIYITKIFNKEELEMLPVSKIFNKNKNSYKSWKYWKIKVF